MNIKRSTKVDKSGHAIKGVEEISITINGEPIYFLSPELYHPTNVPILEKIRGDLYGNPIGKYYCSCSNEENPTKVDVYYNNEDGLWCSRDRFLNICTLLSYLEPDKSQEALKIYVSHLGELDSRQDKIGHKVLEVLAEYIPRLSPFKESLKYYAKLKAEAKKTINKLNKKKDLFLKTCEGQFASDTLKNYRNTMDTWIISCKAQSTLSVIDLHYRQGWLPGVPQPKTNGKTNNTPFLSKTPTMCPDCKGSGLKNNDARCLLCEGYGTVPPPKIRTVDKFGKDEDIKREMIGNLYTLSKNSETSKNKIAQNIVYFLAPFGINEHPDNIRKFFPTV